MPAPRSRPKSHHGCLPCKKRKIKCDETHPLCNRCIKRGVDCQYQLLPLKSYNFASEVLQENTSHTSNDGTTPGPAQGTFQDNSKSDFELLHHYTISTYRSFAETAALESLWSETVPQEAFAHDFLLHGILALSAFHLSYLRDGHKAHYNALATQHYSLCISSFREHLRDPSAEAGGALLACSIVAVVATFASSSAATLEERSGSALDDLISVAALQRGIPALVGAMQSSDRQRSILTPIVDVWKVPAVVELPDGILSALERLEARCRDIGSGNTEDYSTAIENLRSSFKRALSKDSRLLVLEWFTHLPDGFINAARTRDRATVAMIAHFGVALHYCRDFWWIADEGKRVVEEAADVLGDDCDWTDWAKSEVGSC